MSCQGDVLAVALGLWILWTQSLSDLVLADEKVLFFKAYFAHHVVRVRKCLRCNRSSLGQGLVIWLPHHIVLLLYGLGQLLVLGRDVLD